MKLISLAGLVLRLIVSTRRSVPAWALYLATVFAVYSSDPGANGPALATTAALLLPVTTWLAVVCAPREAATTAFLAAAAGGPSRLHAVMSIATAAIALPLIVVAVLAPLSSTHPYGWHLALAGILAHVCATLVGTGLGAMVSRAVLRDTAFAFGGAIVLVIVLLVVPWSSPLGPVVHTMSRASRDKGGALDLTPVLIGTGAAVVWCVVLTLVGGMLAARSRGYGTAAADVRQ